MLRGEKIMNIKEIYIVGAGQMGSGIAQVAIQSGYKVILNDVDVKFVEKAKANIEKRVSRLVEKGKITEEEKEKALNNLSTSVDLTDAKNADLVIEAIVENEDIKGQVFKKLDAICKEDAILASNTSSISITQIAANTKRADKVVGMHFFNPVPVMKLLEITKGLDTSEETLKVAQEVGEKLGKVTVISKDSPGFIVNRLLDPMLNEAIYLLDEGVATVEDIDKGMVNGCNHPMGPLALTDLIGLDVLLAVMEVLYKEYGDPKYRPCPLLRRMVKAGKLGKKTGEGFYKYN
ncbi:MAG: 3-hydroxybutyryl-CoA dehydrogenase [Clostridia bacterium]|jgi:3-hydroxybutyryl-CoA dehydrogenase|nr:3-hydroxybutyryl-CoA dehydrogenase [Clostridia bacterium]MDN5323131.1 3-hydroxybutyryl-CoA dehydrogenase [Clostridia bacterium]